MNAAQTINAYCERLDPSFWAEPLNAVTNAAFLIAAGVVAWCIWGKTDGAAKILIGLLAAIGVGSFLFHTFGTPWAGAADVIPIVLFSLFYIYLATRHFWQAPIWAALLAVGLFFPYAALVTWGMVQIGLDGTSASYTPICLLIALYGFALITRAPQTARGLLIGAGILALSITFRALDLPLCDAWPIGTHFAWHILNGIMLGWMIWVYHRHRLPFLAKRG
ncbi:MAG: ceramidase domain-containing protein [Pseudomonadota bacterium]